MTMPTSNISTYGNSANTASDITIDTQHNHFRSATGTFGVTKNKRQKYKQSNNRSKSLHKKNYRNSTTYINNIIHMPGWPNSLIDPQIVFNLLGLSKIPPTGCQWNELGKRFVDEDEAIRLKKQSEDSWAQTLPSIRSLTKATDLFKYRLNDNLDLHLEDMIIRAGERERNIIRRQIKRVLEYHGHGYGLQRPATFALWDVEKALDDYCDWLDRLESPEHSSCLCDAIQSIIAAVGNDDRLDDFIPQSLAKSLQPFGRAKFYLKINRSHWSSRVEETTLEIFINLAALLEKLLSESFKQVLDNTKEHIEDRIDQLTIKLQSINIMAKNMNNVRPQNSFRAPQNDNTAGIYNAYQGLLSEGGCDSNHEEARPQEDMQIPQLLSLLAYSEEYRAKDIKNGCRAGLSTLQMRCLSGLSKGQRFRDWLTNQQSSALLINGNQKSISNPRNSPLSHFCARIAEKYDGWQECFFLSYFCSSSDSIEPRNPGTMLCQLIGQLVTIAGKSATVPDLTFLDHHYMNQIKKRDVRTLCEVFSLLIRQLKTARIVVFCVIDSISAFEDPTRSDDNEVVLKRLLNIVHQKRIRGHKLLFKLMITAHMHSIHAWKHFDQDERVEMNENAHGGASTDLQLSRVKSG